MPFGKKKENAPAPAAVCARVADRLEVSSVRCDAPAGIGVCLASTQAEEERLTYTGASSRQTPSPLPLQGDRKMPRRVAGAGVRLLRWTE